MQDEDIVDADEFFEIHDCGSGSIVIDVTKKHNNRCFEEAKKRLVERVGRLAEKGCKNTHDKNVQI